MWLVYLYSVHTCASVPFICAWQTNSTCPVSSVLLPHQKMLVRCTSSSSLPCWESFTLSFLTSFSLSWRRSLLHFCSLSRVLPWVRPDSLRLSFRSRNQPVALGWLQVFKGLNENETRGHIDTNILHSNIQTVMECHGVGWKDWCCLAQRKEVYKHYVRDCFLIRK